MFQKLLWMRLDSPKTLPIPRKRLFKIIGTCSAAACYGTVPKRKTLNNLACRGQL